MIHRFKLLGLIALATLPATLMAGAPPGAAAEPRIQAHRIDDWQALSNTELLIRTSDRRRYRAILGAPCMGLRFTDRIAFVTKGETSVDRFAGIQLPDGTRCYFRSLVELPKTDPPDKDDAAQSNSHTTPSSA